MPLDNLATAGQNFVIYRPPNPALATAIIEFPLGSKDKGKSIVIPGLPGTDFPDAPIGLINLNYEDIVGAAHFCNFQFEDLDGSLEALILANRQEIIIKYGYSSFPSEFSTTKKFKVVSFSPSFTGSTVTLNAKCIGSRSSKLLLKSEPKSYKGLTPDEILLDIAQDHDWGDGLAIPAQEFPELTSSSSGNPEIVSNNNNINQLKFINDVLIPATQDKNDNRTGYVLYINEDIKPKSNQNFYFGPRNYDNPPIRLYSNRGIDANIISWSPVLNGDVQLYAGGGSIRSDVIDPYSISSIKDIPTYSFVVDETNISPVQPLGGTTTQSSRNASKSIQSSFTTKSKLLSYVKSIWNEMRAYTFQSTLVILGDPFIQANSIIHVEIALPNGRSHFTSGNWWVQSIKHSITNGSFESELELLRTSMPEKSKIDGHAKYTTNPSTSV